MAEKDPCRIRKKQGKRDIKFIKHKKNKSMKQFKENFQEDALAKAFCKKKLKKQMYLIPNHFLLDRLFKAARREHGKF